jgi:hypothetical protein
LVYDIEAVVGCFEEELIFVVEGTGRVVRAMGCLFEMRTRAF